jgi:hypothetical protein
MQLVLLQFGEASLTLGSDGQPPPWVGGLNNLNPVVTHIA